MLRIPPRDNTHRRAEGEGECEQAMIPKGTRNWKTDTNVNGCQCEEVPGKNDAGVEYS